nr:cysteine proteinase 3 [Ipomoea batatas]
MPILEIIIANRKRNIFQTKLLICRLKILFECIHSHHNLNQGKSYSTAYIELDRARFSSHRLPPRSCFLLRLTKYGKRYASSSPLGALEAAYAQTFRKNISLSEQQLVDCAGAFNNFGCNGVRVFEYVNITLGAEDELKYAIGLIRPVSVAFEVVDGFKLYESGVYTSNSWRE